MTVLVLIPAILSGCATGTMISKRNLAVETKMSNTIFIEPVEPEKKIVYLEIKNTSDKQDLNITESIQNSIKSKGYTITNSPKKAQIMIQANILKVGVTDLREIDRAMGSGYGSTLIGAATGVGAGSLINKDSSGALIVGGLIGAAAGAAIDAMVKDVMYSIVTDIQVSERLPADSHLRQSSISTLDQGKHSTMNVISNQKMNWNKQQTRIISTANQVNLKFEEAKPQLINSLSNSIAGLL